MPDFLRLSNLRTLSVQDMGDHYQVTAEGDVVPTAYPACHNALYRHCLRKTFAELSREVGVDDKTVRHIFDDYVARLKETVVFETPEVLGIDEIKIIGQYRAMNTNVERLALFDMLPNRNKADLIAYFKVLSNKQKVRILTMGLWSVYRQVAQDQFPGRRW